MMMVEIHPNTLSSVIISFLQSCSRIMAADDILFEFLHMEMVSLIYTEQATREDLEKVPFISWLSTQSLVQTFLYTMEGRNKKIQNFQMK